MTVHDLLAPDRLLSNLPSFPLPCPYCGEPLFRRSPKKPPMNMRCPHCKKPIKAHIAYAAARKLKAQRQAEEKALDSLRAKADDLTKRLSDLPSLRFLTRRHIAKQVASLEQEVAYTEKTLASLQRQELAYTAIGYYLDHWYRNTCVPTTHRNSNEKLRGVVPALCNDGVRVMAASENDLGVAGEHAVYRLVKKASEELGSPLSESVVIPRAKIHWVTSCEGMLKLEECEVDCLVATQSCLFLIEVKTTASHVFASNSQQRIALSKQADIPQGLRLGSEARQATHRPFKKDTRILAQSEEEASAVIKSSWPYPASRVFRMVVFVEPLSFANTDCGFNNGLLIGCVLNGQQTFLNAMKRESSAHTAFITRQEVAKLGGATQCSFSIVPAKREKKAA